VEDFLQWLEDEIKESEFQCDNADMNSMSYWKCLEKNRTLLKVQDKIEEFGL